MATVATQNSDWVKRRYIAVWGAPKFVLALGFFLPDPVRIIACSGALIWMGVACLANARRCGRTDCLFTGPFYLVMATVVPLHAWRVIDLGANGWLWIALAIAVGLIVLWLVPERIFGPYIKRSVAS